MVAKRNSDWKLRSRTVRKVFDEAAACHLQFIKNEANRKAAVEATGRTGVSPGVSASNEVPPQGRASEGVPRARSQGGL